MPRLTSLSNINPIVGLSAIPYSWQIESRFSLVNTVWDSPSPNASSLAQNADDFTLTADNEILISDGSADKAIAISINGDTFKNMSDGVSPYGGKFYGYQFVKFKGLYVISEHIRSVGDVGGTGMVHVLDSNLTSVKSLDDSDASAGSFGGGIATDGNYLVITSLKPYTSSYDGLSYKGCLHVYDSNFNEIREIFYGDVVAPLIPGLSRSALENTPLWIYGAGGSATLNMYDGIVYAYSAHLPADSAASVAGVNNEDYNNGVVLRFDVENGTYLGKVTQPVADRLAGSGKSEFFADGNYNRDAVGPDYFAVSAVYEDSTDGTDQIGKVYAFNASDGSLAYRFQSPAAAGSGQYLDRFGQRTTAIKNGTQALISANEQGTDTDDHIYIYDFATGGLLQTLQADSDVTYQGSWASNDEYLVHYTYKTTTHMNVVVFKWKPNV